MNKTFRLIKIVTSVLLPLASVWALFASDNPRSIALAWTPGPPVNYTVTVNTQGGGDCCKVRIVSPNQTDWTSGSVSATYPAGTTIQIDATTECVCQYRFKRWTSQQVPELGGGLFPHREEEVDLWQNTVATAVFERAIVPDQESTIWKFHWTQAPHWGDAYDHRVSSSSNPAQSFTGMTINEDFLTSDMTTAGWTLSDDDKQTFQTNWNGNWGITATNYRDDADGHAFNPTAWPWNQMPDGGTFQCVQKMRVVGCTSADLSGPWFASHVLFFKLIVNQQTSAREVFCKKSGVQGPGDPDI